jgi:hypothetical protein
MFKDEQGKMNIFALFYLFFKTALPENNVKENDYTPV